MKQLFEIKSLRLKILLLLIFSFVFFAFQIPKADASTLNLGIYPPIIQIDSTPPAEISTPFEIHNLSETEVQLRIIFKPFKADDFEAGQIKYLKDNENFGDDPLFFQRVKILDEEETVDSIELGAKQVKKLSLKIDIPEDEPPSDYYFQILFISKTQLETESNNSQNAAGIGTNVLVSVGPKGTTLGKIKEFSAPFWLESGPVPFTIKITNESKHFINPKGEIIITNMFGQKIGRVDLLPVNILAGSTRNVPSDNSKVKNVKYNTGDFTIWPENLLLGPYKANLTIALSEKGPILRKEVQFMALPIQGVLGLILTFLILVIIRRKIRKKLVK